MLVVHVAFECAPIYKTGGLADVVGSLPLALVKPGIETSVIIPNYSWIKKLAFLPNSQVPVWYVDSPYFIEPNKAHDKKIQAPKYAHFCLQTLAFLKANQIRPDIIHCHDWHTGLIPFILQKQADPLFRQTRTLLTIHNLEYQGKFPLSYINKPVLKQLHSLIANRSGSLSTPQNSFSFLKLGISTADYISTVSENHAQEILKGVVDFGLSSQIRLKQKFQGILNGIDYEIWNPIVDKQIQVNYSLNNVATNKPQNKTAFQKQSGLNQDQKLPLFGFIARLTRQKGVESLISMLKSPLIKQIQVAILGTGDKHYESQLRDIAGRLSKSAVINLSFNEGIAHRIYAAADFMLIPSLFEPCGLTQMIAMRYGTIPIGSAVGGIKDSIVDGKSGFIFYPVTFNNFSTAIQKSVTVWHDKKAFNLMQQNVMSVDFSWTKSALKYGELYHKILS